VESIRYVMVFLVYYLLLLGVREVAGLNLDEERRYHEEILLNTPNRNVDWAMDWTVRGSNPGTGCRLFNGFLTVRHSVDLNLSPN
jgi:hypothetical protein